MTRLIFTALLRNIILKTKHWWQRNFGYVYLKDKNDLGDRGPYLFRAKRGKVALTWCGRAFICRLAPNGEVQNFHNKAMRGYGKQYGGWIWSYDPLQPGVATKGGVW